MPGGDIIGQAINQQTASRIAQAELAEQKRARAVSEALAQKEMDLREKESAFNQGLATENLGLNKRTADLQEQQFANLQTQQGKAEKAQEMEGFFKYQEASDKFLGNYVQMFADLEQKIQNNMQIMKKDIARWKSSGMDEQQAAIMPGVVSIRKDTERLQESWDALQSNLDNPKITESLIYATLDPSELTNRMYSPWEISQMDEAALADSQAVSAQELQTILGERQKVQDALAEKQAQQMIAQQEQALRAQTQITTAAEKELIQERSRQDRLTRGLEVDAAEQAAREAQTRELAQQDQQNYASRLEGVVSAAQTIGSIKDSTLGSLAADFSTRVKAMDPAVYTQEVHGELGVNAFMDKLYGIRTDDEQVRKLLAVIPTLQEKLGDESPFREFYDYMSRMQGIRGSKDVTEMLDTILVAWKAGSEKQQTKDIQYFKSLQSN